MTETHYSAISANTETPTHVPRTWFDAQRNALARAEARTVLLMEKITTLLSQLEKREAPHIAEMVQKRAPINLAAPGGGQAQHKSPARTTAPAVAKPKKPALEISF